MREAVLHLSGYSYQGIYGMNYRVKEKISMSDLSFRVHNVIKTEVDVTQAQLSRNGIEVLTGSASFLDPTHMRVTSTRGQTDIAAPSIVIAPGTKPAASTKVPLNERSIINSDQLVSIPEIPTTLLWMSGGVIGFPSLASVSMEQGRLAAAHAFGIQVQSNPANYPYGIYTIPEISFAGKTEEQLTDEGVPYEVGLAYFRETARGQIRGDTTGRLKIIFHRETREILGVHIIGEEASELLHIGQAVIVLKGTIDYFVDTVFNYPTLAECYKQAAFNGINKLSRF